MLKTWAAAIWLVQIILQQNAVALIRIYNENFVWQLILSWYLSIQSYRSNHCSKEMYSGRAGLAALPLGMGRTVKNFRRKLLMKCVKAVLVLRWRGWDRGTIIFVVCLLLSPHRVAISAANRLIGEVVQSQRRPLLGPSPGWKRLLVLSHLRQY